MIPLPVKINAVSVHASIVTRVGMMPSVMSVATWQCVGVQMGSLETQWLSVTQVSTLMSTLAS